MKSFMECQVLLLQKKLPFPGYVEFTQWAVLRTHFCRRTPMKSWRPIRAKTLRQKTVRIITSASFLTDWIRAPTMVFRPGQVQCNNMYVNLCTWINSDFLVTANSDHLFKVYSRQYNQMFDVWWARKSFRMVKRSWTGHTSITIKV